MAKIVLVVVSIWGTVVCAGRPWEMNSFEKGADTYRRVSELETRYKSSNYTYADGNAVVSVIPVKTSSEVTLVNVCYNNVKIERDGRFFHDLAVCRASGTNCPEAKDCYLSTDFFSYSENIKSSNVETLISPSKLYSQRTNELIEEKRKDVLNAFSKYNFSFAEVRDFEGKKKSGPRVVEISFTDKNGEVGVTRVCAATMDVWESTPTNSQMASTVCAATSINSCPSARKCSLDYDFFEYDPSQVTIGPVYPRTYTTNSRRHSGGN